MGSRKLNAIRKDQSVNKVLTAGIRGEVAVRVNIDSKCACTQVYPCSLRGYSKRLAALLCADLFHFGISNVCQSSQSSGKTPLGAGFRSARGIYK
jgi:hypothetical protein